MTPVDVNRALQSAWDAGYFDDCIRVVAGTTRPADLAARDLIRIWESKWPAARLFTAYDTETGRISSRMATAVAAALPSNVPRDEPPKIDFAATDKALSARARELLGPGPWRIMGRWRKGKVVGVQATRDATVVRPSARSRNTAQAGRAGGR